LWLDASAQHALWSHVGDSRLYRFRHGRAELLTVDDSVVQQMVLAGILDAAQSRNHPRKNHLVAALGIEGEVDPHTVARAVHLLEGDAYLLCSDGWWDHFEPDDMAEALHRAGTPEAWLQDMQAHVRKQAAPRQDNFTAIAVWVGDPSQMTIARFEDTVPRGQAPSP
jgi:serine/threonine protein phosphatase PrpC